MSEIEVLYSNTMVGVFRRAQEKDVRPDVLLHRLRNRHTQDLVLPLLLDLMVRCGAPDFFGHEVEVLALLEKDYEHAVNLTLMAYSVAC